MTELVGEFYGFGQYLAALEEEVRLSCVAEILKSEGKSRRAWIETLTASAWVFEYLRDNPNLEFGKVPPMDRGPMLAWAKKREPVMVRALVDICVRFKTDNRQKALRTLDRLDEVFALIEKPSTGV